jgi:ribonucleoside-diphosphate reductase alpha chain
MQNAFSNSIMELRYSWDVINGKETWSNIATRVPTNVLSVVPVNRDIVSNTINIIDQRKFIPGGRFLAQSGRMYHQTNNCFCLRAEDTREGWGDLLNKATLMLMSGGGIGIDYSELRSNGSILKRSGGTSSGPIPLMKTVNEVGRGVMAGGKRRSAIWAGLRWNHKDVFDYITLKNWIPEVRKLKEKDYDFPASMDMTNISVILDKNFFDAYKDPININHDLAHSVYWNVIERMLKTGEPGFSVDYDNMNESLRNACTEIVSEDDSDACCLGSINLANIKDLDELKEVTELAQLFLIAGTEYSDAPTEKVKQVRSKNRRTGLGLMGIHEWLITRGYDYDENAELATWLQTWKDTSDSSAKYWSNKFNFNEPVKKRAVAPNGSTAIVGGMTTGGLEPIFSVAYQRRYLTPDGWKKQYVVDFVAEKLVEQGIDPNTIEDAYMLSMDVERRMNFQSFVQQYVDNSISSTINLPTYGTDGNNDDQYFGNTLMKYLPSLRGITVYPDGARGGQPLVPVDYKFAVNKKGVVFEGNEECIGGICGL